MNTVAQVLIVALLGGFVIECLAVIYRAYRWDTKGPTAREVAHAVTCLTHYLRVNSHRVGTGKITKITVYNGGEWDAS